MLSDLPASYYPLTNFLSPRRDLTVEQRFSYIDAVHCLHTLPPHDKTRAATTRFEEFQATHILLTDRIHSVVRIRMVLCISRDEG